MVSSISGGSSNPSLRLEHELLVILVEAQQATAACSCFSEEVVEQEGCGRRKVWSFGKRRQHREVATLATQPLRSNFRLMFAMLYAGHGHGSVMDGTRTALDGSIGECP